MGKKYGKTKVSVIKLLHNVVRIVKKGGRERVNEFVCECMRWSNRLQAAHIVYCSTPRQGGSEPSFWGEPFVSSRRRRRSSDRISSRASHLIVLFRAALYRAVPCRFLPCRTGILRNGIWSLPGNSLPPSLSPFAVFSLFSIFSPFTVRLRSLHSAEDSFSLPFFFSPPPFHLLLLRTIAAAAVLISCFSADVRELVDDFYTLSRTQLPLNSHAHIQYTTNFSAALSSLFLLLFVKNWVGPSARALTALPCRASRLITTPPPSSHIHSEKRWNETSNAHQSIRPSSVRPFVMSSLFFSHVPPTSRSSLFTPLV